MLLARNL